MLMNNKNQISTLLIVSVLSVGSMQVCAGSSSVNYPKIKNNGSTWYHPSTQLRSYYDDYFIDMERSFKAQVINDKQFSESLLNVCGEVSALFYRYLHNQAEKPLYSDTAMIDSGFQTKEALPFISDKSQYNQSDMYIEYPKPARNGKYYGQFVYEYQIKQGVNSIFQLDKNLGGGNGKRKEILFLANMNNYYIDENGNKKPASEIPLYVMLKIDRLTTIKQLASETAAFEQGKLSCAWFNKRLSS